jgi:hypothetical protein
VGVSLSWDCIDHALVEMRTDGPVKDPLTTVSRRRRTLSNITNLSLSASWVSDPKKGLAKSSAKGSSFTESQLREENTILKRLLSEKDATIHVQAGQLDQMQKDFLLQIRRQAQVNEELISYNSRLSRDSGQSRDQLKLLQHEYSQMTVAYRVTQSELQIKLEKSQELVARLLEQAGKSSHDQFMPSKVPSRPQRGSTSRRHSIANLTTEEDWNSSRKPDSKRQQKDAVKRPEFTSPQSRQTQQQADNAPTSAPTRTQSSNLYCDLRGLDPMPEGSCEDANDSMDLSTSEEVSSGPSSEFCRSGNSGSGITSESTSRRRRSGSSELSSFRRKSSQMGNATKANERASAASVSSSAPVPHFSRRVAINSNLVTEHGRPLRRAVVKVATYTEPSLVTKMRRAD